jgi:organic hydroperoxide reductase OsmC/OhrA
MVPSSLPLRRATYPDHVTVHTYRATCRWSGSTATGYENYGRAHEIAIGGPGIELQLSSDPAFGGNPAFANPEQLLLAAAVSCQLLSFLAVAARARIDVVAYEDEATAVMPEDDKPVRITRVDLHPQITVTAATRKLTVSRLEHLVEVAHHECFIANSLRSEIVVRPSFSFAPGVR